MQAGNVRLRHELKAALLLQIVPAPQATLTQTPHLLRAREKRRKPEERAAVGPTRLRDGAGTERRQAPRVIRRGRTRSTRDRRGLREEERGGEEEEEEDRRRQRRSRRVRRRGGGGRRMRQRSGGRKSARRRG
jgi:hypothetical protein